MKTLIKAVVSIIMLIGCATTWPDACPVVDSVRHCKCAVLKFTITDHPTNANGGVVGLDCDGTKLPLTATGEAVVK